MKHVCLAATLALLVGCSTGQPPERRGAPYAPGQTVNAEKPTLDQQNAGPQSTDAHTVDPTNTAINKRDRSDARKTPIDQDENQKDIDITAKIRSRIVDEKLSVNGHNCKIITHDGRVTLRGPVQSDAEKQLIEKIAIDVAGADHVDNQLEVQP